MRARKATGAGATLTAIDENFLSGRVLTRILTESRLLPVARGTGVAISLSGFTTTFAPNTRVPHVVGGTTYDVDISSIREGISPPGPTRAAVTSRSHHGDLVNASFMDGSVRSITSDIDLTVWRGLGSRAGGETVSAP